MSVERRFFVKICGLRDAVSAQAAVDAGADALGFILAPARRQVEPAQLATIVSSLDRTRNHPAIVGVTVNAAPEAIATAIDIGRLEAVQLSGDEAPEVLKDIDVPVFKALRFPAGTTFEDATRMIDAWFATAKPVARLIIEGLEPGAYGGTGTRADLELVEKIALRYPVVLAGGLTPGNVAEAIATAHPWGVDVSSGVERDGEKDVSLIRSFIAAARAAGDRTN